MEITCPSCQEKHDSSLYPDAFEIQCSCGYSILIPDLSASSPAPDPSVAVAVVEEDEALKISTPQVAPSPVPVEPVDPLAFSADAMTPSEDLPEGMVYDPTEIPGHVEAPAIVATHETTDSTSSTRHEPLKKTTHGQKIIEKSLLSQAGQFLGSSYTLRLSNLTTEALTEVKQNLYHLTTRRPWLLDELKKRSIDLDSLTLDQDLADIPEVLAVELYLLTVQLGGSCTFRLQDSDL